MKSSDIFKAGTKIQWIIYEGLDPQEAPEVPLNTKISEINFDLKLKEIKTERDINRGIYVVTGVGVII